MTGDGPRSTGRRRFLRALGAPAAAAWLAGCTTGDGEPSPTDDGDDPADEGGEGTTDTPTDTPGDGTPTDGGGDETPTDSGSSAGAANVRTPRPDEDRDWDAVAARQEASGFDLPEGAPTAFGFSRVAAENRLTVSYGSMAGSDPVESGTVYVLLVVEGRVEGVLAWEPPIEDGDQFLVGPDDSALATDVGAVTALVFAWERAGDLYVVDRKDEVLAPR